MLYLLAILFPPLAVLLSGKPFQAILNIPLTCLFWIPGMIHAFMVVGNHYADQRTERILKAQRKATEDAMAQAALLSQAQIAATQIASAQAAAL